MSEEKQQKPRDELRKPRARAVVTLAEKEQQLAPAETASPASEPPPPDRMKAFRSQYEQAARTSPDDFENRRANVKDPAVDRLGDLLAYNDDGTIHYRQELITNAHSDLQYDIYQRGGDAPTLKNEEDDRARAAAVLAAVEYNERQEKRKLISVKARRQLQAIAYGDEAAYTKALDGIQDKRRTGPRQAAARNRRTLRKSSSFQTAEQADAAQRFKELNAVHANRHTGPRPKPQASEMFSARELAKGGRQTRQKFKVQPKGVLEMEDHRTQAQKDADARKAEEELTYKMEI